MLEIQSAPTALADARFSERRRKRRIRHRIGCGGVPARFSVEALGGERVGRCRGFTLIELLIVMAIIAILTTIALASYNFAIIKANRSSGASCLLQEAQRLEQWYTTNLTYATAANPAPAVSACVQDVQVTDATYNFTLAKAVNTFTLTATPKGRQLTGDTLCGTLTINQVGLKTESGAASDVSQCF